MIQNRALGVVGHIGIENGVTMNASDFFDILGGLFFFFDLFCRRLLLILGRKIRIVNVFGKRRNSEKKQ